VICSFVSSQLSVEVISCFEVKPRRRRYETSVTDRKAFLPARRRPQGLVVIGVCLSVCLCVCLCALCYCVCPQDISRTGSWITTKFGGWDQGVNL